MQPEEHRAEQRPALIQSTTYLTELGEEGRHSDAYPSHVLQKTKSQAGLQEGSGIDTQAELWLGMECITKATCWVCSHPSSLKNTKRHGLTRAYSWGQISAHICTIQTF